MHALRWLPMLVVLAPSAAFGQVAPAFSWVRIGTGAAWLEPRFPPGDYWRAGPGPALRVETPLRPGVLGIGFQSHRARAGSDVTDPRVEEMRWSLVYLGWGDEARLGPLALGAEARLGALLNTARDAASNPDEREVLFGAGAWARTRVHPDWSVALEGALARIDAHRPWRSLTFAVRLERRFGIGPAVADALRSPGRAPGGAAEAGPAGAERSGGESEGGSAVEPAATLDRAERGERATPSWWASMPEVPERVLGGVAASTDRIDHIRSPGHLRSPEAGAPTYWLDGIPIRSATLGGPAWPWLPFGTPDLASVDGLDRPGLRGGRPELEGSLSATTRPPAPGDRVRARVMTLNESGDPGPLRFTDLTSPNVDGPLYELDASAGHAWNDGWLLASGALRERWSVTRPELRERNPAFFRGSSSRVRSDGASLAAGGRVGRGRVSGRAWAAGGDRFLRGSAIGSELSSDVDFAGAGVSLTLPAIGADTMRAYAVVSAWEVDSPNRTDPATDPRTLDWAERDVDIGASYQAVRGPHVLTGGLDVGRATDALDGAGVSRASTGLHASYTHDAGAWRLTTGARWSAGDPGGDGSRSGVLAGVRRAVAAGAWIGATVSWAEGDGGGPLELWDRAVERPELLDRLGVVVTGLAERTTGRRATLRAEAGWRLGGAGEMRLTTFHHDFGGERRPSVRYAWTNGTVTGTWGPLEAGSGRVQGVGARFALERPDAGLVVAVEGMRAAGTPAFERWWAGAPRLRARADGRRTLRPGWTLVAGLRARSGVTWAGLEEVTPRGSVPGGGRIPASVDADLRLEARLVDGRVRLAAGMTNLFDADVRLHPLGAGEARGLLIGVGFAF